MLPAVIVSPSVKFLCKLFGLTVNAPEAGYLTNLFAVTLVITTVAPAASVTTDSATTIAPATTLTIVNVELLLAEPVIVILAPTRNPAVTNPFPESEIVFVPEVNEIVVPVCVEALDVSY